jgi:hypothetical protein
MQIIHKIRARLSWVLLLSFFTAIDGFSQTNADSLKEVMTQKFYQEGMQFKNGSGVKMDYYKAYTDFSIAAQLGDPQSTYALGYMLYKGLGCTQDYAKAAAFFSIGAKQNRDNSMYFFGLCYRNGYGVALNRDSARYWLAMADSLGYGQAALELSSMAGENSNDSAKALVQQIKNAAMPIPGPPNQFTPITHLVSMANMLPGRYIGWVVQYDWSGQNVVDARKLTLTIKDNEGRLSGTWMDDKDTASFDANLNSSALEFKNAKYKRKDHYSLSQGVTYEFKNASINMAVSGDSLFLVGDVNMFSPDRNEPSKPIFVALARLVPQNLKSPTTISAYPNPFSSTLTLDLQLGQFAYVAVELITVGGQIVYNNLAGEMQAGVYQMQLQPGNITRGVYFLKVQHGNTSTIIKVIKK